MAPTALARFREALTSPESWHKEGLLFGWGMAFVSTLAFSIASPVAKSAIDGGMDPTALLTWRLLLSTLLLGGSIALTAPQRLLLDRRGLLICGGAGLGNGLGMVSFFWALTKVDASVAAMVFALSPLAVLALLALRGEKFTRRHTVRIILGLSGVYLLIGPGGNVNWMGVGLVCLAITSYAIHLSLIQWYLRDYDARTVTLYVIAGMSVTSIIFWWFQGIEWQNPGWSGWLSIIVLAVVSTYLARLTMFAAIRSIGSGQIALLAPTETLLTVMWSMIFLQERLTPWQWAGGLLILTSALLAIVRLNRAQWRPRWRLWPKL